MNTPKYACWYLINGYKCKNTTCNFSHDPYTIYEYRKNLELEICPTKCNKIHNKKELFYDCYNETRKRKRSDKNIEENDKYIEKLKNKIIEITQEKDKEIEQLKNEVKENIDYLKLKYALFQSKREIKAIKEVHKEVLNKEYLDENYKYLQENQQKNSILFNTFRLDFYNMKDDDPVSAIQLVQEYICNVNNAIQHRYKKIHS